MKTSKVYKDICYRVDGVLYKNGHSVEIRCYWLDHNYVLEDETDWEEYEKDPDKPQLMVSGFIKWDKCANLSFGPYAEKDYNTPTHFCEPNQIERMGTAAVRAFDVAKELMGETADW